MFGFTATSQEAVSLKRKADVSANKQVLKTDIDGVSAIQTKKLAKYLNLSDSQITAVGDLVGQHLKTSKFQDLINKVSANNMSKSLQKEEGFNRVAAELYNDEAFSKDLNAVLDDKQKDAFKDLNNKYNEPR